MVIILVSSVNLVVVFQLELGRLPHLPVGNQSLHLRMIYYKETFMFYILNKILLILAYLVHRAEVLPNSGPR